MSRARAFARVCAFLGFGFGCLSGVNPELAVAKPRAIVLPPRTPVSGPAPVIVALHGMCGGPEYVCASFEHAATSRGFLVCPRATLACAGGGVSWDAGHAAADIEDAVAQAVNDYPGRVDRSQRTLVGFSQGAFIAMRLAHESPGRWPRLVLLAAK